MLSLLDGQFYHLTPVPNPVGSAHVRLNPTESRLEAYIGNKRVHYGPIYMKMTSNVEINAKTGEFKVKYPGLARFRVIFGDYHLDFDLDVT